MHGKHNDYGVSAHLMVDTNRPTTLKEDTGRTAKLSRVSHLRQDDTRFSARTDI